MKGTGYCSLQHTQCQPNPQQTRYRAACIFFTSGLACESEEHLHRQLGAISADGGRAAVGAYLMHENAVDASKGIE